MAEGAGNAGIREVKLFISSPGDVIAERERLMAVIARLNARFAGTAHISPVNWPDHYYRGHDTFQAQIAPVTSCDIVISIFWTRLGTELPPQFPERMADGRPYPSGTAYEVLTAREAAREKAVPDLYVFRKTAEGRLPTNDATARDLFIRQLDALDAFWQEWFHTREGHFIAGFKNFSSTDDFEKDVEQLLLQWLSGKGLLGHRASWQIELRGSPFRSLEPFDAEHADVFFGRTTETERGNERLIAAAGRSVPFLLVVGASGTGKSSLARAGLIPRLIRPGGVDGVDRWRIATMKAGFGRSTPLEELAAALLQAGALPELAQAPNGTPSGVARQLASDRDGASGLVRWGLERISETVRTAGGFDRPPVVRLLLLIDQFEGLFAGPVSAAERAAFAGAVDALVRSGLVWTIATLRSSEYALLQADPIWLKLKEEGATLDLVPPDQVAIAEAIRGPAEAAGLVYEYDAQSERHLDETLRADTARADALPLLQFTMQRLFEERRDRTLTFDAYRALGGIEGAIAAEAERAVGALPQDAQDQLPWLLRHLVGVGRRRNDAGFALREMMLDDKVLLERPAAEALIKALDGARVLVLDSDEEGVRRARLAHEAVLRSWRRAREAVEANARYFQSYAELQSAAFGRWQTGDSREDHLLRGTPLAQAEDLVRDYGGELPPEMIEFVRASRRAADRGRRFAQAVAAVMVVLFLGASAAGIYAYRNLQAVRVSEQRAVDQRNAALIAQSRYLAGVVRDLSAAGDKGTATALALEAVPTNLSDPDRPFDELAEGALREATWGLREQRVLRGHDLAVRGVAYSPDGKQLLTASADGTVRLWDPDVTVATAVLRGHTDYISSARYSPDGAKIVTASGDRTARIWDAPTGEELLVLQHSDRVFEAEFSRDGNKILTAAFDQTARLWDARTGKQLVALPPAQNQLLDAALSADGKRLATASVDDARIWDAQSGRQLLLLKHDRPVLRIVFSPDGTRAATGDADGVVRLWDARDGRLQGQLRGHEGQINTLRFSADGKQLLSTGRDMTARLWDVQMGKEVFALRGHTGSVYRARFSPDGNRIVTTSDDRTARLWDAKTGQQLAVFAGHDDAVTDAVVSPDGGWVATSSNDKTVRLWFAEGADDPKVIGPFPDVPHLDDVAADGLMAIAGGDDRSHVVKVDGGFDLGKASEIVVVDGTRPSLSPDGKRIATIDDRKATVWQIDGGKQLAVLSGHEDEIRDVSFSPDGTRLVTASEDKTARIWDAVTGKLLMTLRGQHGDMLTAASFSPDGHRVVTASVDKTACVWDVRTGTVIAVLHHEALLYRARFSPDGKHVLTASNDGTARLWDAQTGEQLAVLHHRQSVLNARFSGDGRWIATASIDKTARLWDAQTGELLSTLRGHTDVVGDAIFLGDGQHLITTSSDRTMRLWRLRSGQDLIDYACSIVPRELTDEQRKAYFLPIDSPPRCPL